MASPIDWNLIDTPARPGPGAEVASLNGMLSALAERRMKAQQFQQQQEFLQWQEKAVQANRDTDNQLNARRLAEETSYNNRQLTQRDEHQRATVQAALEAQQREHGYPEVQKRLDAQDPVGAEAAAKRWQLPFAPRQPDLVDVPDVPEGPPPVPREPQSILESIRGDVREAAKARGAPDPAAGISPFDAEAAVAGMTPEDVRARALPLPPRQLSEDEQWDSAMAAGARFGAQDQNKKATQAVRGQYAVGPANNESFMSATADATAKIARGKMGMAELDRVREGLARQGGSKHAADALDDVRGLIASGDVKPEDIPKMVMARIKEKESQDAYGLRDATAQRGTEARAAQFQQSARQRAFNEFRRQEGLFDNEHGMKDLVKTTHELKDAQALLDTPAGPAQLAAMENFFRHAKGGNMTAFFFKAAKDMGSGMLGRIGTAIEHAKSGQLGGSDMEAFQLTFQTMQAQHNERLARVDQAYRQRFINKRENWPLKNIAIGHRNSLFGALGLPEIDEDPDAPSMDPTGQLLPPRGQAPDSADGEEPADREPGDVGSRPFGSGRPSGEGQPYFRPGDRERASVANPATPPRKRKAAAGGSEDREFRKALLKQLERIEQLKGH